MDALGSDAEDAITARYLIVATLAFQAYDYITSFDDEIHLVWSYKTDFRHIQFLVNRYMPFATSITSVYYVVLDNNIETCSRGFWALVFLSVIGMLVAEFTVFLRADAVWGHKQLVRLLLAASYLGSTATILFIAAQHASKNSIVPLRLFSGCLYVHDDRSIWIALLLYSLCEFLALSLLLLRVFLSSSYASSPTMRNLYQDGAVYFSIITVTTVVNLVLVVTASPTLSDAFIVPESVLVNILCAHMHLRIRKSHSDSLYQMNSDAGIELRPQIIMATDG